MERGGQRPDIGLTSWTMLNRYSKYDVPSNIQADVKDYVSRFGRLKLRRDDRGGLLLTAEDALLMLEVSRQRKLKQFIIEEVDERTVRVNPAMRGHVKKALVDIGYPAEDLAGYVEGAPLNLPAPAGDAPQRGDLEAARLPAGGRGRLPRGRRARRGLGCDRAALRRRQDDGRHGGDGRGRRPTR